MDNWSPLLTDPHLVKAFGYTVLHSLWQGALIALIYGQWLKRSKASNEDRYTKGLNSLVGLLGFSSITFMYYFGQAGISDANIVNGTGRSEQVTLLVGRVMDNPSTLIDYLPIISNVWIIGVLIYSLRLVLGGIYTYYLRKSANPLEAPVYQKMLKKISTHLGVEKGIQVASSVMAKTPMMIGHMKPIILLPIGLVNQLDNDEVEAIICHEIAHIMRNDYLVNILQTLVEVLYYYHPAVYYISEQIRVEREHCCDDIAIQYTKNSLDYAKLLVKLQELHSHSQLTLAMHFKQSNNIFMNRIKRLLHLPGQASSQKNRIAALLVMVLMIIGIHQSAHSISKSIEDRILLPVEKIETVDMDQLRKQAPKLVSLDTTPTVKKIIKKKTITIIDGDSTVTETITETDGNGAFFLDDDTKILRWFPNEERDFNIWMDSIKDGMAIIDIDKDIHVLMDSLGKGMAKMKLFLNDGNGFKFQFDTAFVGGNSFDFNFDFDSIFSGMELRSLDWDSLIGGDGKMFFFDGNGMEGLPFDFDHLEDLEDLNELRLFDRYNDQARIYGQESGNTPADKLHRTLNRDGLLEINTNNTVELSGKELKINGDKQPKNIHSKYKRLWENATGTTMAKKDKVTLELKGKEHKRTIQRF